MPPAVELRFYEELNDFLPPGKRKQPLTVPFASGATVADLLGRFAVPVERVDLILRNGMSVGLSQVLRDGDRISVYPVFESLDITPVVRLRERPLRVPRFLAGSRLFGLARLLCERGYDVKVEDAGPAALAQIAEEESRIWLVEGALPSGAPLPSRTCRVVSSEPAMQLDEVLARLDLAKQTNDC
jgi:hypothetical protein